MIKKLSLYLLLVILLASCSKKPINTSSSKVNVIPKSLDFKSIQMRAKFSPDLPDFKQSATINLTLAGKDSLILYVIGPFGIPVGKMYADKEKFLFYNTFENVVFKGNSSAQNLKKVSGIGLSFEDFTQIIYLSTYGDVSEYKLKKGNNSQTSSFENFYTNFEEIIELNNSDSSLKSITRLDDNKKVIFKANYYNYSKFSGIVYPKDLLVELPDDEGKMEVSLKEIKFDVPIDYDFGFDVPDDVPLLDLDERSN